ncbi:MAG: DUF2934 domain-containing protein [Planctomycetota bacterium]
MNELAIRSKSGSGQVPTATLTAVESIADKGTGPSHETIAKRAYELYEESGCQNGRCLDHWLQAEQDLAPKVKSSGIEPRRNRPEQPQAAKLQNEKSAVGASNSHRSKGSKRT